MVKRKFENISHYNFYKDDIKCKKIKLNESEDKKDDNIEYKNLCVICKIDLGPHNPRQLCGKTYCYFEDCYFED